MTRQIKEAVVSKGALPMPQRSYAWARTMPYARWNFGEIRSMSGSWTRAMRMATLPAKNFRG